MQVIRSADQTCGLNAQIEQLQCKQHTLPNACTVQFEVCLTGDGKAMMATNWEPGTHCWHCNAPKSLRQPLDPCDHLPQDLRYFTIFRAIPPTRRGGDYLHCSCRVLCAYIRRLTKTLRTANMPPHLRSAHLKAVAAVVKRCNEEAAHHQDDEVESELHTLMRVEAAGGLDIQPW